MNFANRNECDIEPNDGFVLRSDTWSDMSETLSDNDQTDRILSESDGLSGTLYDVNSPHVLCFFLGLDLY